MENILLIVLARLSYKILLQFFLQDVLTELDNPITNLLVYTESAKDNVLCPDIKQMIEEKSPNIKTETIISCHSSWQEIICIYQPILVR